MEKERGHVSILKFFNWLNHLNKYKLYIFVSILFFVFAGVMNYFCGKYADAVYLSPDLILDIVPVYNLGAYFVFGIFVTIGFFLFYPLLFRLEDFCYTFNQFSFLVIIRNFFIILTPLQYRPEAAPLSFPWLINSWNFNNDLFFSGHVAIPFLGFLIFKDSKVKYVFLGLTFLMAIVTILTHRHYSIDIFAAPFITYSCYKLFDFLTGKFKFLKIFGKRKV